jgi:hypothetical protein
MDNRGDLNKNTESITSFHGIDLEPAGGRLPKPYLKE